MNFYMRAKYLHETYKKTAVKVHWSTKYPVIKLIKNQQKKLLYVKNMYYVNHGGDFLNTTIDGEI